MPLFGLHQPSSPYDKQGLIGLDRLLNARNSEQLLGMIENAQKVIKVIQTVGPVVQKYEPIVRNLPSMISILKEFRQLDADNEETNFQETKRGNTSKERQTAKKSVPRLYL